MYCTFQALGGDSPNNSCTSCQWRDLQHLSVDNTPPLFSAVVFVLILTHLRGQDFLQETVF